jgi:hypothetical protein
MALSQSQSFKRVYYLLMLRSFLIWTFTLTVCLLIIGFPLIILMVTVGSLAAIVLQSVMPFSGVLVVAGSLLTINILGILLGAAILTIKGTHPQEVDWLRWLHGETDIATTSVYAACPLTCDIKRPA